LSPISRNRYLIYYYNFLQRALLIAGGSYSPLLTLTRSSIIKKVLTTRQAFFFLSFCVDFNFRTQQFLLIGCNNIFPPCTTFLSHSTTAPELLALYTIVWSRLGLLVYPFKYELQDRWRALMVSHF